MKQDVMEWQFMDEMQKHGFSYGGSKALFAYFEQLEEDMGEEIDFDPIAIRCDYSEYRNFEELRKDYSDIYTFSELCEETLVIEIPKTQGFIIHNW